MEFAVTNYTLYYIYIYIYIYSCLESSLGLSQSGYVTHHFAVFQQSDDRSASLADFARKRLQLAECLLYKVLENILQSEKRRLRPRDGKPPDLSVSHMTFGTAVLA